MRAEPEIRAAARRLRREMTPPEVRLWLRLKANREGPRFRRQCPLDRYILDFYCPSAKVAIEVDGWCHNLGDQPRRDEARDARLAELGILTLRYPASEVMADADGVADSVWRTCLTRPLSRSATAPP